MKTEHVAAMGMWHMEVSWQNRKFRTAQRRKNNKSVNKQNSLKALPSLASLYGLLWYWLFQHIWNHSLFKSIPLIAELSHYQSLWPKHALIYPIYQFRSAYFSYIQSPPFNNSTPCQHFLQKAKNLKLIILFSKTLVILIIIITPISKLQNKITGQ